MKETEDMTPREIRDWDLMYSTPLEVGIRNCWEDWQKAAEQIEPSVNWHGFFDACFVPLVDVYSLIMCIGKEEYYPLAQNARIKKVLEAAILKVMRIPFHIELTTREGGRETFYWLEFKVKQLKKFERLHINISTEIFTFSRTNSTPPA